MVDMKKIIVIMFLVGCAGVSCYAQISLEWMKASASKRRQIEQTERLQEVQSVTVPNTEEVQKAGLLLEMKLRQAHLQWIWNARQEMLLPAEVEGKKTLAPVRIWLPAWRWARRRQLTRSTLPLLYTDSAAVYRLDFSETDPYDLLLTITAIPNLSGGDKRIKVVFFAQKTAPNRYDLCIQPYLVSPDVVEKDPDSAIEHIGPKSQDAASWQQKLAAIKIGQLWR